MSQCTSIPAPSTAYLSTLSLHDALPICRIASLVAKRPQAIWIGLVIVLALPLLAAPQFKASGVAQSEFVLGDSEARDGQDRSEEHTSELQSRGHLVCRLLLEKKKKHDDE